MPRGHKKSTDVLGALFFIFFVESIYKVISSVAPLG
jgi:hypothetical protein